MPGELFVMRHRLHSAGAAAHLPTVMVRTLTSDGFRPAALELKVSLV
jgi:hypothetical protein